MKKISIFIFTVVLFSCQKGVNKTQLDIVSTISQTASNKQNLISRTIYVEAFKKFKLRNITKFKPRSPFKKNVISESIPGSDNGTPIYYITGSIVGDPNDEVIASYGPTILAASNEDELAARDELQVTITAAKNYLSSAGLDFTTEFSNDDFRYIHAANIVLEMETKEGFPPEGSGLLNMNPINIRTNATGTSNHNDQAIVFETSRENTVLGCLVQAVGIRALYDAWYDKFATKRMLITMIGKIAARYMGFVGTALAVYDFIDCMW